MKVSIIILNWNGGEVDCIEAIESAMAQSYANKELIFVDNGSSDGSGLTMQQRYSDLTYISLEKNIGCPPGRNVGAHQAKGDLLFFLENDGVWDNPELISDAVDLFTKHQKLGAVYTLFIPPSPPIFRLSWRFWPKRLKLIRLPDLELEPASTSPLSALP